MFNSKLLNNQMVDVTMVQLAPANVQDLNSMSIEERGAVY